MPLCAFIGDELSAAGFRLAGVDVHVPAPDEAANLFRDLLGETQLILITAEVAGWLPGDLLAGALRVDHPLILVIPDVRGKVWPPDLASLLRRQLGMSE